MEKRLIRLVVIMILCLVPACIAFESYPSLEFSKKIAFAVLVYLACLIPLSSIIRLADSDYRLNASTSVLINRWMDIIVFPLSLIIIDNIFSLHSEEVGIGSSIGIFFVSFMMALTISGLLGIIIKYFVKR